MRVSGSICGAKILQSGLLAGVVLGHFRGTIEMPWARCWTTTSSIPVQGYLHALYFSLDGCMYTFSMYIIVWLSLYCQMSILIHPNHWIQAFQLHPWPRVCKIKHQGMQTVATNTCERISLRSSVNSILIGLKIYCFSIFHSRLLVVL